VLRPLQALCLLDAPIASAVTSALFAQLYQRADGPAAQKVSTL